MFGLRVMKKILSISILMAVATCAYAAPASQAEKERDPFFPAGPRSSMGATAPQDSDWGRDPFSKPFEGKTLPAASSGRSRAGGLTGIIYGRSARVAIIDGEAYKEGSKVGDQKLVDIRKRSVVLMNHSGSREEIFLEDFSIGK